MPQHVPIQIESLNTQGIGVRVVFEWQGDRYGHTIYRVEHNTAWRSQHALPGQPVFQELHEQRTEDERSILFLNGAGDGVHWSMSVEPSAPGALTFDVAARVSKPPVPEAIRFERTVDGESTNASHLEFAAELPDLEVRETNSDVTIQRVGSSALLTPATIQWKYSVGVLKS